MFNSLFSRRFLFRIFIALLFTGLIQVALLSVFSMLFSTRMLDDSYRTQSEGRMSHLVNALNTTLSTYRETTARLAGNERILDALFEYERMTGDEVSLLYQDLYKNLSGKIDDVSIHFLTEDGRRTFSTHVLPAIYNPNSSEQSLTTYLKLKQDMDDFPIVDSFVNPKGDQVAISLFHILNTDDGQRGFIITDVNIEPIIELIDPLNAGFFSNIYLVDNTNYKFVSLYREGEAGNFSRLGWKIPAGVTGVLSDSNKIIVYADLYSDELSLAAVLPTRTSTQNLFQIIRMTLGISIVGLIISSLIAYALAKRISRPVTEMVGAMKKVENGDLSVRISEYRDDEFSILFHGFNKMSQEIQTLLDMRVAREKALRTAQRQALQSQINPHFLYNTLNTVKALSKLEGVDDITLIITQLGKLLRDAIDSDEEFTTIGESLHLVEAYLQIQRIRFGSNFCWNIDYPEEISEIQIPRLIIQPIVENSVVHGLQNLTGEKRIDITVKQDPLCVCVSDNGGSLVSDTWERALKGGCGVGLKNVNDRLRLYYGSEGRLSCDSGEVSTTINIFIGYEPVLEEQ